MRACPDTFVVLHLLAIATAEGDDVIREAIAENYRRVLSDWAGTYERAFLARGLRPRPGASFAKLADMAEGMAMRELGDARSPVWTSEIHTLFGEGAMWLLLAVSAPRTTTTAGPPRTASARWPNAAA